MARKIGSTQKKNHFKVQRYDEEGNMLEELFFKTEKEVKDNCNISTRSIYNACNSETNTIKKLNNTKIFRIK